MRLSRAMLMVTAIAVNVPVMTALAQGQGKGAKAPAAKGSKAVQRGEYLVRITGCNDCHTPMKMGPQGPAPDMTQMLSGHPAAMQLPPPPAPVGPWMVSFTATNTAFAGPWGVTYAMNLTPDKDTGIGNWTEQNFIQAMRTGKHMGQGRPIMPPMPWQNVAAMTDEDIKAVFAYLKSVPAIKNQVPEWAPPAGGPPGGAGGPPGGQPAGGPPGGQPAGKAPGQPAGGPPAGKTPGK